MRQAKVSWEGPGTPIVMELSPLLAGQLALMMEMPEIAAAVKKHPRAYAGVTELHAGICEAIGDYGRRFWADPNTELFPMAALPSSAPDAPIDTRPRPFAIGRAKVA